MKSITEIEKSQSTMTESQLQTVVACLWLKLGIPAMKGGEKLSKYLEKNINTIESIFGADDRVYIRSKTAEDNKNLAEFILKEGIGDKVEWKKCKESDRWWLMVWWG